MNFKQFFKYFHQLNSSPTPWSEHWRSALGGILGGALVAFLGKFIGEFTQINEWAMASLGASALLIFVLPSSPMAQPKAVIGGNMIAALVGVSCALLIPDPRLGMPIAIGASIIGMLYFNCLHAPAAATALSAVLGHIVSYRFALFPVLVDSLLLVLAGIAYNRATGKQYPHQLPAPKKESNPKIDDAKEIKEALVRYQEFIDVDSTDLAGIIHDVESHAFERKLKSISCSSMMNTPVTSVNQNTSVNEVWLKLIENHIKSMPVIDGNNHLVGIIALEDFVQHHVVDLKQPLGARLRRFKDQSLLTTFSSLFSTQEYCANHIMKKSVLTFSPTHTAFDLLHIFEGNDFHHIPVVNEEQELLGIITQADFAKAIHQLLHSGFTSANHDLR